MMNWYCLFALATAIMAMIELYVPAMRAVSDKTKNMVKYSLLTYVVYFIISLILAPFVFYVCINPKAGIIFRDRLIEIMSEA